MATLIFKSKQDALTALMILSEKAEVKIEYGCNDRDRRLVSTLNQGVISFDVADDGGASRFDLDHPSENPIFSLPYVSSTLNFDNV